MSTTGGDKSNTTLVTFLRAQEEKRKREELLEQKCLDDGKQERLIVLEKGNAQRKQVLDNARKREARDLQALGQFLSGIHEGTGDQYS